MDPRVERAFRERAPAVVGDECAEWPGTRTSRRYGVFVVDRRQYRAHRVALELHLGRALRDDEDACHHCDNPPCCHPLHLFAGSKADNQRDKRVKGRAAKGEQNGGGGKLTADDVIEIRRRVLAGETKTSVALAFGVTRQMITLIDRREKWAHV